MSEIVVIAEVLESAEVLETMDTLVANIDITEIDITELDKSIVLEETPLPELSDEMREILREKGYSEEVIDRIGSDAEAQIYLDAELECQTVNGKDVLMRDDIDLEQTDVFGLSNLERMERGLAPLDADGKPIELHHIGQKPDSPLAELTCGEHRGPGNTTILHDVKKESEIDRNDFNKERAEHWKARAEEIKNQQNEVAA
ncbi:HNH/ENDO VII family nuclease [Enterobacter sp.]|uniref:HNH/ENDO VII family nuclease n=1 Tax=Enterobacter sp. TaxID=42895 RepID=UPI00296EB2FF|nr:HNH/ENDO VII family nuclease [Enterobacter sp.]